VGAKYSPDFAWNPLRASGQVQLMPRTLVRRLVAAAGSTRIERAIAVNRDRPDEPVEFRARTFIVAAGYAWSSHLLLLSSDARFPNGVANRSGLVGRYLAGHRGVSGFVRLPLKLFPGINEQHSLVTKQFMRPGALQRYLRHDLRIWESSSGRTPRLRNDASEIMLGDEIMRDWRSRTETGTARVRGYYDVLPDRTSALTLDAATRNEWGDPMPRIQFRDSAESAALRQYSEDNIRSLIERMARAGGGEATNVRADSFQDHPAGGCRMGNDPGNSVTDSWGRSHDHENLFVVGAPTCVTASCANGTLTFAALSLRSAAECGKDFPAR
jgi:quinoprotein glucose dehydrogenase